MRKLIWILLLGMVCAPLWVRAQQTEKQNPPSPPAAAPTVEKEVVEPERPALKPRTGQIVLPAGTRLPLILHNSVSTRSAHVGDPVYLETLFPVTLDNRIIIPAGSYVHGEIVETKRPGRVKGRGEMLVRLNLLILPNGYTVNFNAVPTGAGTGGNEQVEGEGKIKGDSDKASDVGTVLRTTTAGVAIGAGIGGLAGNVGRGAGIGTLAGAAAGLIGVLATRGPELELPRGTTLDVLLNRPLYLDASQINFTDPGRASSLAGPPNRQPVRTSRFPY